MTTNFLLQENGFFLLMENSGNIILESSATYKQIVTGPIDVFLEQQDAGYFDILVDADGDIAKTNSLDTAIAISILTDRRASSSDVAKPEQRRGWWGNLYSAVAGHEIGSKLWLLEQARLNRDSANRAQNYIEDCLQWLITDGYVASVNVTTELVENGIKAQVVFA